MSEPYARVIDMDKRVAIHKKYSGKPRLGWILTRGEDPPISLSIYPLWAALAWVQRHPDAAGCG